MEVHRVLLSAFPLFHPLFPHKLQGRLRNSPQRALKPLCIAPQQRKEQCRGTRGSREGSLEVVSTYGYIRAGLKRWDKVPFEWLSVLCPLPLQELSWGSRTPFSPQMQFQPID